MAAHDSRPGTAENGPFKIKDDLTLEDNPNGWDVSHNMVYVDQPIGTGYSYSDDPADAVHGETGTTDEPLTNAQVSHRNGPKVSFVQHHCDHRLQQALA